MGSGQRLWKRAKKLIPGGNMLLSKRAEMFLPERWPAYFSKSKGCTVWDLDGAKYTDMSIMGIGTNILGYGHPEVDEAVKETVTNGNMSTLNCPEGKFSSLRISLRYTHGLIWFVTLELGAKQMLSLFASPELRPKKIK